MDRSTKKSLKKQLILLNVVLVVFVLLVIILYVSKNSHEKLEESIYHDLETQNEGYVNTIFSTLDAKAQKLLFLRNDLELYDTIGQMWIHIASHTGDNIFNDPHNKEAHIASFHKKLSFYQKNGQLDGAKMTPQLQKMLDNITRNRNTFDKGMKFFYLGIPIFHEDKVLESYDQYQDSSLWVPDPDIEAPYNPLIRPWYIVGQEAGRERVIFTEPYAERRTKEAVTSIATNMNINGIKATLAGAISIKPIMDDILSKFRENAHITILSKGIQKATDFVAAPPKYIYSSRDDMLGDTFKSYNDKEIIKDISNRDIMKLYDHVKNKNSGVIEWVVNNEDRLVAYNTVPHAGWKILTSVSKHEMMKEATELQNQIILIALLGTIVLIVSIYYIVNFSMSSVEIIGKELKDIANTGNLSKRITPTSVSETNKIATDINQMLDDTVKPVKKLSEIANKIATGKLNTKIDIFAKGDIAVLVDSFTKMTNRLISLEATSRDASPLTGLPGGVTIENSVKKRIDDKAPFVFCMFDLDNFKPFNDRYGYIQGNLVIKNTAKIIEKTVKQYGDKGDFIGHIGGDDFVVITTEEACGKICHKIMEKFDIAIKEYYNKEDQELGYIKSKDRQGNAVQFPIMSLSIAAVSSKKVGFTNYIHIGEISAELKSYAKKLKGSNLVTSRRNKTNTSLL